MVGFELAFNEEFTLVQSIASQFEAEADERISKASSHCKDLRDIMAGKKNEMSFSHIPSKHTALL